MDWDEGIIQIENIQLKHCMNQMNSIQIDSEKKKFSEKLPKFWTKRTHLNLRLKNH